MTDRVLSALGLCKRAGKLVMGFDPVAKAALERKLALILTAADLSPKSRKETDRVAQQHGVPLIPISSQMDEIWFVLGKRAGILGVADEELAQNVRNAVNRANEEEKSL